MASESAARPALDDGRERRLHPLSWLFVLLRQIRSFALPLLFLLVLRRGGGVEEGIGLVAVVVLTLAAVLRYFTFRFRIASDELTIRSGLLQRNVRHLPLARIQSVSLHRTLLHRLLGVAEVRLETAVGGNDPEARMSVLSLADAQALERMVEYHRGQASGPPAQERSGTATAINVPPARVLLRVPAQDLFKLGLASGRGTVLLAAGIGFLFQVGGDVLLERLIDQGMPLPDRIAAWNLHGPGWAALAIAALFVTLVLGRLLAVAMAFLGDFGFTLEQAGPRLSVERGLFTKRRASAPLHRVQRWTRHQNLLLRAFGRESLRVQTAASPGAGQDRSLTILVPIAAPTTIDALLRDWLPDHPAHIDWKRLHPRAWRRFLMPQAAMLLVACLALGWQFGPIALTGLLGLPPLAWLARRRAACCAYAMTQGLFFWRHGWLDREITFIALDRIQTVQRVDSPFDRRHGMAGLRLDTAGGGPLRAPFLVPCLPEAEARALQRRLASRLIPSRRPASAAPAR